MFMHDARHTSQSPYQGAQRAELKWSLPLDISWASSLVLDSIVSPLMNPFFLETIYVGSSDNNLYAINPDGTIKWSFPTEGAVTSTPAVGWNRKIYFGSQDYFVYALHSDGSLYWSYETGGPIDSSPVIADNKVYITSMDEKLYAFKLNGELLWATPSLQYGINFSSPAISSEGNIVVGSLGNAGAWSSGKIHIRFPNGSEKCSYDTYFYKGNGIRSSPSIDGEGNIFFGTYDDWFWGPGGFYVLDQSCQLQCYVHDIDHYQSSPAISEDGNIYLGTNQGLRAMNSDCSTDWIYPTGRISYSTPAIGADGIIYVGDDQGVFSAINPNGTLKWSYQTDGPLGSPSIGRDGAVYVGAANGSLYAFRKLDHQDVFQF